MVKIFTMVIVAIARGCVCPLQVILGKTAMIASQTILFKYLYKSKARDKSASWSFIHVCQLNFTAYRD